VTRESHLEIPTSCLFSSLTHCLRGSTSPLSEDEGVVG
jgi:hypothetical protein